MLFHHQITQTVNSLENNPEASASLSIGFQLIAFFIKVVENGRINPLVMDCTQWVCWVIGGLVGICSLVGFGKQFIAWTVKRIKRQPPSAPTHN